MRAALELGRWTFPAPIGYLNAPKWSGKSLVPDTERAPLIARAFEELATGRFTKQEVSCPNDRGWLAHAAWIGALAAKLRPDGAELDLRRQGREP